MTRPIDSTTTTGAKRTLLIQLLEDSGIPTHKSEALADELICKFKWIARSISMYFDTSRVLTAYEERDEKPGTDAEKKQYNQFIALHPSLPEFVKFVVSDEGLIDDLGKVIDHHISEAKNSDTNTLRHLITKLLPENPNRDVIDPPLTGKSKSERGFNHKMTGALLCPLSLRAEYDRDPGAFNDKVNAGKITINLNDYPSGFYPPKTPYDEDFIEEKLFQGYSFIRALRAIFSGEESALDGKHSAAKASQAEMHGLACVTPEAVTYTGVHLVFALTDIENWAVAHHSGLHFAKFHADMVRIFADPEDEWGTETLDYLTSKLPKLRKKQAKRKRPVEDEDSEGQKESATTKSLKNRQARRAQRAAVEQERQARPEQRAEPHPPAAPAAPASEARPTVPPMPPAPPLTRRPNNVGEDENEPPQFRRQTQRRVLRSPSRSLTPEVEQPPPSSSPAPQSSPPQPSPGLMGPPPPPRYPHTLWELTNDLRNSRPSFMNCNRSPTQEPDAGPSHNPLPLSSSRRSTLRTRAGLSTDGFGPFKARDKTCWPIVVFNYNIPPEDCFKEGNCINVGTIPGPKKPWDMDSFAYPLTEELVELEIGVEAYDALAVVLFQLHAYMILGFGDIPALSMLLHMKGQNSWHPCWLCDIIAIAVDHTLYVPLGRKNIPGANPACYDATKLPLRTHQHFLEQVKEVDMALTGAASERLAKKYGIKGLPILTNLSSLSFPQSFPYDFMHLIWENLMKNLISFWTGTFKDLDHIG